MYVDAAGTMTFAPWPGTGAASVLDPAQETAFPLDLATGADRDILVLSLGSFRFGGPTFKGIPTCGGNVRSDWDRVGSESGVAFWG